MNTNQPLVVAVTFSGPDANAAAALCHYSMTIMGMGSIILADTTAGIAVMFPGTRDLQETANLASHVLGPLVETCQQKGWSFSPTTSFMNCSVFIERMADLIDDDKVLQWVLDSHARHWFPPGTRLQPGVDITEVARMTNQIQDDQDTATQEETEP